MINFATLEKAKLDIRSIADDQLAEQLKSWGESAFRIKQIKDWLWMRSATNFDEMTSLSQGLRAKLKENFVIQSITEDLVQNSSDGTIKSRYKLHDDHLIESVLIPVKKDKRFTVCVSSQVGCSLSCSFCATGKMKRMRNLSAGEIYDQVVAVNKQAIEHFSAPLTNIVYMGMGEPLLNYNNVLQSIHWISNDRGLNMSPKRITLSTAGVSKMITKMGDDKVKFNLALSLHAADDKKRNEIMPINESNDLRSLMDSIYYYYKQTKNRVSYEYIAFQGFNDSMQDAKNLAALCQRFPVRVNIIEYNPIEGVKFHKSSPEQIDKFAQYLRSKKIMVTVRRSRGKDIDAACGQLANK